MAQSAPLSNAFLHVHTHTHILTRVVSLSTFSARPGSRGRISRRRGIRNAALMHNPFSLLSATLNCSPLQSGHGVIRVSSTSRVVSSEMGGELFMCLENFRGGCLWFEGEMAFRVSTFRVNLSKGVTAVRNSVE